MGRLRANNTVKTLLTPKHSDDGNEPQRRFHKLVKWIKEFGESNNRIIIIVYGDNNSGKSSCSETIVLNSYVLQGIIKKPEEFNVRKVFSFSARQALTLAQYLREYQVNIGRFVIVEEGQTALFNSSVGAVQEFNKNAPVNRFTLINWIINLPNMEKLWTMIKDLAHALIFVFGPNDEKRIVKGYMKIRYRWENQTVFGNPDLVYYDKGDKRFNLKKWITMETFKNSGGAYVEFPYVSQEKYDEYNHYKLWWYGELERRQGKRMDRLEDEGSGDHTEAINLNRDVYDNLFNPLNPEDFKNLKHQLLKNLNLTRNEKKLLKKFDEEGSLTLRDMTRDIGMSTHRGSKSKFNQTIRKKLPNMWRYLEEKKGKGLKRNITLVNKQVKREFEPKLNEG